MYLLRIIILKIEQKIVFKEQKLIIQETKQVEETKLTYLLPWIVPATMVCLPWNICNFAASPW